MSFDVAPDPGSFGLSIIGGKLGKAIAAGQAFTGDGSRYTHAFFVLDNNEVIQAMPHGAEIVPLSTVLDNDADVVFCDLPVKREAAAKTEQLRSFNNPGFWNEEKLASFEQSYDKNCREELVKIARTYEGTPYNFLDYLYLTLADFGIRWAWLSKRIASKRHLICSQLVDQIYNEYGIHLFNDGRLPMDVTPGDLDNYRVNSD